MLTTAASTRASFHLWWINEIYSTADGSLQFVEFFTGFSGQQFVGGQNLTSFNGAGTMSLTYTFPGNTGSPTANHTFLAATAQFESVAGFAPDFILPDNFLFREGGSLDFAGADSLTFGALPTDGVMSVIRSGAVGPNSPMNFLGQTTMLVPEPSTWALLGAGSLVLMGLGTRRRK